MTGGVVVVLGTSGRNVAAGMTGGIAYFLDEEDNLLPKINKQIVNVKRVDTYEGEQQLLKLIHLFKEETGSIKATNVIKSWDRFLPKFWQLVPPSEVNNPVTSIAFSSFKALFT